MGFQFKAGERGDGRHLLLGSFPTAVPGKLRGHSPKSLGEDGAALVRCGKPWPWEVTLAL